MFHNGVEERFEAGSELETGELVQDVEERVLRNIQGDIAIPGESDSQRDHPVAITQVKLIERSSIPAVGRFDQLMIGRMMRHDMPG